MKQQLYSTAYGNRATDNVEYIYYKKEGKGAYSS